MRLGKSLASARLIVLAASTTIFFTSAAETKKSVAHFPKQLHGMWLGEMSECPPAGEASDSDMQMHIDANTLGGYEDVSKPTKVTLLSSDPMTWRIESMIDTGPSGFYETDTTKIFVLGKEGLTVVAEGRGNNYQRCARDKKRGGQAT